jgi:hypothetical protein
MKNIAIFILFVMLFSCNNDKPSASLVKSAESTKAAKKKGIVVPEVKYGIEGFYTGGFVADKYDESKEYFNNRITICIDSLDDTMAYGHSVVAGNERPFSGNYTKQNGVYSITAKEPGDNKYDGVFDFTVAPGKSNLTGTWKSNDQTLAVTERSYELEPKKYKYDPSRQLPEEVLDEMIHGTYNEKTDKGERLTSDVLKYNASTTLLKSKDVENMYKGDLEVLRNSIYARHGYSFKNPRMRTLFDYVDWYMPAGTDVTSALTDIEKKNIELIKRYEKHAEKYYDEFGR